MKLLVFLIFVSINMLSCYHVYYAPNTVNTPLLTKKDEMRVNAFYVSGAESDFKGGELQIAYALQKHWGILFNGMSGGRSENTGTYEETGNGTYGEFAGGYFKSLDKKDRWIAEVYAGFGGGSVKNDYGLGDNSKVGVTKFFIQPALGFKSDYFEFAFSPRMGVVNWKAKENNIQRQENDNEKQDMLSIQKKPSFFVFEPGFILRAGGKNVKIQTGMAFSSPKSSSMTYYSGITETITAHLGISFNFNTRIK